MNSNMKAQDTDSSYPLRPDNTQNSQTKLNLQSRNSECKQLSQNQSHQKSQETNPVKEYFIHKISQQERLTENPDNITHLQNAIRLIYNLLGISDQVLDPLNSVLNGRGSLQECLPGLRGLGEVLNDTINRVQTLEQKVTSLETEKLALKKETEDLKNKQIK